MTEFVIVAAAAAMLAGPMPAPGAAATVPGTAPASVALNAPTAGFRTYPDAASCEQGTAALVAPAGVRLICVPVEPMTGEMANAH